MKRTFVRWVAVASILAVVVIVPYHKRVATPPPLHHTTNLTAAEVAPTLACVTTGACAQAFAKCKEDVECSAVVVDMERSLRQRRILPLLPRNQAMRGLTACAEDHCFERHCYGRQRKVSTHNEGYLTNDVVKTDTEDECEKRCADHVPPVYPESCRGWTWMGRARIDAAHTRHTCFLVGVVASRHFAPGAISGKCAGGPSGKTHSKDECVRIREAPQYLAAYLKATTRGGDDVDFEGLFNYMHVVDMCPSDVDFDDALHAFTRKKHSSASSRGGLLGRIFAMIVDVVEAVVDMLQRTNPSLLLALLVPLLPKLRSAFPKLSEHLTPLFEAITAHHKKPEEKKKRDVSKDT